MGMEKQKAKTGPKKKVGKKQRRKRKKNKAPEPT